MKGNKFRSKSFTENSLSNSSSSYTILPDGTVKRKRHKNSYTEIFLERKNMGYGTSSTNKNNKKYSKYYSVKSNKSSDAIIFINPLDPKKSKTIPTETYSKKKIQKKNINLPLQLEVNLNEKNKNVSSVNNTSSDELSKTIGKYKPVSNPGFNNTIDNFSLSQKSNELGMSKISQIEPKEEPHDTLDQKNIVTDFENTFGRNKASIDLDKAESNHTENSGIIIKDKMSGHFDIGEEVIEDMDTLKKKEEDIFEIEEENSDSLKGSSQRIKSKNSGVTKANKNDNDSSNQIQLQEEVYESERNHNKVSSFSRTKEDLNSKKGNKGFITETEQRLRESQGKHETEEKLIQSSESLQRNPMKTSLEEKTLKSLKENTGKVVTENAKTEEDFNDLQSLTMKNVQSEVLTAVHNVNEKLQSISKKEESMKNFQNETFGVSMKDKAMDINELECSGQNIKGANDNNSEASFPLKSSLLQQNLEFQGSERKAQDNVVKSERSVKSSHSKKTDHMVESSHLVNSNNLANTKNSNSSRKENDKKNLTDLKEKLDSKNLSREDDKLDSIKKIESNRSGKGNSSKSVRGKQLSITSISLNIVVNTKNKLQSFSQVIERNVNCVNYEGEPRQAEVEFQPTESKQFTSLGIEKKSFSLNQTLFNSNVSPITHSKEFKEPKKIENESLSEKKIIQPRNNTLKKSDFVYKKNIINLFKEDKNVKNLTFDDVLMKIKEKVKASTVAPVEVKVDNDLYENSYYKKYYSSKGNKIKKLISTESNNLIRVAEKMKSRGRDLSPIRIPITKKYNSRDSRQNYSCNKNLTFDDEEDFDENICSESNNFPFFKKVKKIKVYKLNPDKNFVFPANTLENILKMREEIFFEKNNDKLNKTLK